MYNVPVAFKRIWPFFSQFTVFILDANEICPLFAYSNFYWDTYGRFSRGGGGGVIFFLGDFPRGEYIVRMVVFGRPTFQGKF